MNQHSLESSHNVNRHLHRVNTHSQFTHHCYQNTQTQSMQQTFMLCQCQMDAFVNGQHTRSSKHLKMWITSVQESWSRGKKADLGENRSGDQVDKVGTIFAFNCHIDETGDCQMMWCDWWKENYSLCPVRVWGLEKVTIWWTQHPKLCSVSGHCLNAPPLQRCTEGTFCHWIGHT